jgi:hypothetical protein
VDARVAAALQFRSASLRDQHDAAAAAGKRSDFNGGEQRIEHTRLHVLIAGFHLRRNRDSEVRDVCFDRRLRVSGDTNRSVVDPDDEPSPVAKTIEPITRHTLRKQPPNVTVAQASDVWAFHAKIERRWCWHQPDIGESYTCHG